MSHTDPFHPYAAQHAKTAGPGDARPTALDVARDAGVLSVNGSNPWAGRVVLVTGATSGIGIETARALHATGADVYITARNLAKAKSVVDDILASNRAPEVGAKGKLEVIEVDMDSLTSVKKAADEFLRRSDRLNVLVNNAGIMACPYTLTVDGIERHFAVNHLAHFVLIVKLLPTLRATARATPGFASRVVQVSSGAHMLTPVRCDDVNFQAADHPYVPFLGYGQSKTAMQWTANYIDRVYGRGGKEGGAVHANSAHPGAIWTGLQEYMPKEDIAAWKTNEKLQSVMKTPSQGAATTVWAAVSPTWEGLGGAYLANCGRSDEIAPENALTDGDTAAHATWAFDPPNEDKLWKLSLEIAGLEEP